MFRNRTCDRRVETSVEGVEFLDRDGRTLLEGERGNRLADIAIIMDDLGNRKAGAEQVASVTSGGRTDGVGRKGRRRRLQAERLDELGQEQRDAVLDLAGSDRRPWPAADPIARPSNDDVSVQIDELVQHRVPRHTRRTAAETWWSNICSRSRQCRGEIGLTRWTVVAHASGVATSFRCTSKGNLHTQTSGSTVGDHEVDDVQSKAGVHCRARRTTNSAKRSNLRGAYRAATC
jgi:hypothetical protein